MILRGELDLEDAPGVDAAIAEVQAAAPALLLDLRGLTFIDSSGTRVLWAAHLRAEEGAGALTVLVGPGPVRRALAVTGLDEELDVIEDGLPGHDAP